MLIELWVNGVNEVFDFVNSQSQKILILKFEKKKIEDIWWNVHDTPEEK